MFDKKTVDIDEEKRKKNREDLFEMLSSELFGEKVIQFYETMIQEYEDNKKSVNLLNQR